MAWSGRGGGQGPKAPTWYPPEGRSEVALVDPPAYGQPGRPGKRVDEFGNPVPYWTATVQKDGVLSKWFLSGGELRALEDAGRPGQGAVLVIQKTTGRGITVVVAGGQPAPQQAQPQRQPQQAQAQPHGGYDLGRRVSARVFIHRKLAAAFAQADVPISDDALSSAVTGELIEWSRQGSPELAPVPAAGERPHPGDGQDEEDMPF